MRKLIVVLMRKGIDQRLQRNDSKGKQKKKRPHLEQFATRNKNDS